MFKKTIALVLVLVLAALCACGKKAEKDDVDASPDSASQTPVVSDTDTKTDSETKPDAEPTNQSLSVSVSLNKLGEITDENFDPDDVNGYDSNTKQYSICDYMGENKLNDTYDKVEPVTGSDGLFYVTKADKMPNGVGLVSRDGKVYIPCSAAIIEPLSDRFFTVFYAENEVTDKEEALFYFTESHVSIGGPKDGDTMYAGYGTVYDLETKDFIPDVKVTESGVSFITLAPDCIGFENAKGTVTAVYEESGKQVSGFPEGTLRRMGSYIYVEQDDQTDVYDGTGKKLFSTGLDVDEIYDGKYFASYDDDACLLYDSNGNTVTDVRFEATPDYDGHYFWERKAGEDAYGVIDTTGAVVIDFDADYIEENRIPGFLVASYDNDTYALIGENGTVFSGLAESGIYSVSVKEAGGAENVYVFADNDYTLKLNDVSWGQADFIAIDRDEDSRLFAAYETVTGAKLLDYQYRQISQPNNIDALYCKTEDGTWEVYRIQIG